MTIRIAVSTHTPEKMADAKVLAAKLNLDFLADSKNISPAVYDYVLLLTPSYLGLYKTADKKAAPFYIDFLTAQMTYRMKHSGLRKELLARALGCKPSDHLLIVDATAGLLRDSFILAALGFEVTALERSSLLFVLLQDGVKRASEDVNTAPIMSRLHLIHTDAITWLKDRRPDVIYLDPMFPKRQKSAVVKKEMVILQDLLGKDPDADALLTLALTCATRRVVVKRPRLASPLAERQPHFSMLGSHSRFDIYLTPTK